MVVEALLDMIKAVIITVFGFLPNLPNFAVELQQSLFTYLDTIFNNLGLIDIFIDIRVFKYGVPIFIAIYNFEHIYNLTKFILKKIPCLNIG